MLICTLQKLDDENRADIMQQAGTPGNWDRLNSLLNHGTEVAVLCQQFCEGTPDEGYYDIAFACGVVLHAISGTHLKGIEHWRGYAQQLVEAKAASRSHDGCTYHVNRKLDNTFVVSDWYDTDSTVSSWCNGRKL